MKRVSCSILLTLMRMEKSLFHRLKKRSQKILVSHVFRTINQIEEMGALFRKNNILFVVDGAQSIAHMPIDVQRVNADFFAFSGHKIGAPMGIGGLYGRKEVFESLEPFLRGGGMILEVSVEKSSWADLPARFEI